MSSQPPEPPLAEGSPALPGFPPPGTRQEGGGCLKWGLIGCAGASVLLIGGLVFLGTKAPDLLEGVLKQKQRDVLAACAPDVGEDAKREFNDAFKPFLDKAKSGKVAINQITAVTTKTEAALTDHSVSAQELKELTEAIKAAP